MEYPEAGFCGDYCGKCSNYPDKCRGYIPVLHEDCHFTECCMKKNIEHCGLCEEFPCKKLNDFVSDDRSKCPKGYHIENLRIRRSIGTEAWLKSQRVKWKDKKSQL